MPQIHPSAVVDPSAQLAEDVVVGPFSLIEGPVKLGPGCIVRPYAQLIGPLVAGEGNDFGSGCVIGDRPQHLQYKGEPTRTIIGNHNVFREHATVHRGTTARGQTVVGDSNFLMAGAHIAHDCIIGNHCILANGALVGGHAVVEDRVFLSGNSAVGQFCRVGRLALLSGVSATTKDIPPFVIQQDFNRMGGVNLVGMRRAGFTSDQIHAVREAYRIVFLRDLMLGDALERVERELGGVDVVAEFVAFVRNSKRGVTKVLRFRHGEREDQV